jgi:L-amino acid N-acyltransferase
MDSPKIRLADEADLAAINEIYNYYVLHSTCTYQEVPEPIDGRRRWFTEHDADHPVIVAEIDREIVGWGSVSLFRPRSAYRHTAEDTVYVRHDFQRRGVGSAILLDLIARARASGHHALIAGVDAEQAGSIALHAKFGFQSLGRLKQVGYKFDRWLDVIYMELRL